MAKSKQPEIAPEAPALVDAGPKPVLARSFDPKDPENNFNTDREVPRAPQQPILPENYHRTFTGLQGHIQEGAGESRPMFAHSAGG